MPAIPLDACMDLGPGDVRDEWREGETVRAVMVGVDRWRTRLLTSPLPTPGEVAGFVRAVARYPGPGTLPEGARDDLCASIAQVVRGGGSCEWGGVRWGRG